MTWDEDLPTRLTGVLAAHRLSPLAARRMSPELSYGRHAGPAPFDARRAAVVLLLFRRGATWYVPLTERPATLTRHGGQISLPGGAIEPGESSSTAALRELAEELGVVGPVTLLGQLPQCYVFASNFAVTPWVAYAAFEPTWEPHDDEVGCVVELPLAALFDPAIHDHMAIERGPLSFRAPCLRIGSACIWGATSVILEELADVLQASNVSDAFRPVFGSTAFSPCRTDTSSYRP